MRKPAYRNSYIVWCRRRRRRFFSQLLLQQRKILNYIAYIDIHRLIPLTREISIHAKRTHTIVAHTE